MQQARQDQQCSGPAPISSSCCARRRASADESRAQAGAACVSSSSTGGELPGSSSAPLNISRRRSKDSRSCGQLAGGSGQGEHTVSEGAQEQQGEQRQAQGQQRQEQQQHGEQQQPQQAQQHTSAICHGRVSSALRDYQAFCAQVQAGAQVCLPQVLPPALLSSTSRSSSEDGDAADCQQSRNGGGDTRARGQEEGIGARQGKESGKAGSSAHPQPQPPAEHSHLRPRRFGWVRNIFRRGGEVPGPQQQEQQQQQPPGPLSQEPRSCLPELATAVSTLVGNGSRTPLEAPGAASVCSSTAATPSAQQLTRSKQSASEGHLNDAAHAAEVAVRWETAGSAAASPTAANGTTTASSGHASLVDGSKEMMAAAKQEEGGRHSVVGASSSSSLVGDSPASAAAASAPSSPSLAACSQAETHRSNSQAELHLPSAYHPARQKGQQQDQKQSHPEAAGEKEGRTREREREGTAGPERTAEGIPGRCDTEGMRVYGRCCMIGSVDELVHCAWCGVYDASATLCSICESWEIACRTGRGSAGHPWAEHAAGAPEL